MMLSDACKASLSRSAWSVFSESVADSDQGALQLPIADFQSLFSYGLCRRRGQLERGAAATSSEGGAVWNVAAAVGSVATADTPGATTGVVSEGVTASLSGLPGPAARSPPFVALTWLPLPSNPFPLHRRE